jgi:hypothetical protein
VVDEEAPADSGAWVNFDSREKPADLRDHARYQWHAPSVELVREPVRQHRVKTRVTKEDLDDALRRGVFAEDGIELFPDGSKHGVVM